MQIVMWFAGLRGAVSFALSLSVSTENRPYIVTTTLTVVVVTTFILGGFTEKLLTCLGLSGAPSIDPEADHFEALVSPGSVGNNSSGMHKFWKDFDNYVRSLFLHSFENCSICVIGLGAQMSLSVEDAFPHMDHLNYCEKSEEVRLILNDYNSLI